MSGSTRLSAAGSVRQGIAVVRREGEFRCTDRADMIRCQAKPGGASRAAREKTIFPEFCVLVCLFPGMNGVFKKHRQLFLAKSSEAFVDCGAALTGKFPRLPKASRFSSHKNEAPRKTAPTISAGVLLSWSDCCCLMLRATHVFPTTGTPTKCFFRGSSVFVDGFWGLILTSRVESLLCAEQGVAIKPAFLAKGSNPGAKSRFFFQAIGAAGATHGDAAKNSSWVPTSEAKRQGGGQAKAGASPWHGRTLLRPAQGSAWRFLKYLRASSGLFLWR